MASRFTGKCLTRYSSPHQGSILTLASKCRLLSGCQQRRDAFSDQSLTFNVPGQSMGSSPVFLMGPPGCGKTTVASIVGERFNVPVIDVDEFLEQRWNTTVANKLKQLGDDGFLAAEAEATLQLPVSGPCIVSLSGSNPLNSTTMKHVHSLGRVVYLDVLHSDILSRLHFMKIDRIVGLGRSIADNLNYRQQFYESVYDARVLCEVGEKSESIADKVAATINHLSSDEGRFISTRATRSNTGRSSFSDVLLQGSAMDGGLFVPVQSLPTMSLGELSRLSQLTFTERALRIIERLINPREVQPQTLARILQQAYDTDAFSGKAPCGIEQLEDLEYVLELFHGPTGSFKDLSTRLMSQLFQHFISADNKDRRVVLVATSGDTGSAVAHSFTAIADNSNIHVVVLFPESGVTELQKLQLLSAARHNVSVVGVNSDFDFCQRVVKTLLTDRKLNNEFKTQYNAQFSVANSINWVRLIGQIVYHISGYLDLVEHGSLPIGQQVDVCVPTGNFGNVLAAYYAKEIGLPIRKLICASNCNNSLTELINTGYYNLLSRGTMAQRTVSPAIDIIRASNIERYIYSASGCDGGEVTRLYNDLDTTGRFQVSRQVRDTMRSEFLADWCMDDTCLQTISDTYKQTGYLLDTHTAVAKSVANKFRDYRRDNVPVVITATAHYSKCASDVLRAIASSAGTSPHPMFAAESVDTVMSELQSRLVPGTRPVAHRGLADIVSQCEAVTQADRTVLPGQFDAVVDYLRRQLSV